MSAICENGLKDDLARRPSEAAPSDDPQWPYFIGWTDQTRQVSLTVDGNWTGAFDQDGFTMSITQNTDPTSGDIVSSTFTFDYSNADVGSDWATATQHADDGDTEYGVYLSLIE